MQLPVIPAANGQKSVLAKYQRGDQLSPEESRACKDYYQERRQRRQEIYWPTIEDRQAIRDEARQRGMNASDFAVEMMFRGMRAGSRTQEEWDLIEEERDRSLKRLEDALDLNGELVRRNNGLQDEAAIAREAAFAAHEELEYIRERAA